LPQTYCPDCGHNTHYVEGVDSVACKRCGRLMSFKYSIEKIEGDPVTWLLHRAKFASNNRKETEEKP
jgi:hypothetical protein